MLKVPYELQLGLRYTRARRRNGFISFISLTSMLGIALGITALITVLSIMNGFQEELRERILGMTSHMTINEENDRLKDWSSLYNTVINQPHVEGGAPNIMEQGMLTFGQKVKGVAVRGILPEFENQVSDVGQKMLHGSLKDLQAKQYRIILGSELALALGVSIGDKITLIAPQGSVSPVGVLPRIKRFTVAGLFEVGMNEYDSGLAIMHIEDAKKIFKYGDYVGGLQLQLDDLFKVGQVKNQLSQVVTQNYYMRDWRQQHTNFFKAIEMEKRMMFIVLTLIVMVAAFNIVSTMVMVVTDKRADIAVLRTLGASPMGVQLIFIIQGMIIGVLGVLLGLAGGLSLALNIDTIVPFIEQLLGIQFFPPDVYYISTVPSKLVWADVWYIVGVSFILTLLATLYPARKAASVNPAEALRYE